MTGVNSDYIQWKDLETYRTPYTKSKAFKRVNRSLGEGVHAASVRLVQAKRIVEQVEEKKEQSNGLSQS